MAGLAWLGLAVAVSAVSWRPPDNLSNLPGRSAPFTAALDPASGDLFVAWQDAGLGGRDEIVIRQWDQLGPGWLPPLNLPPVNLSQSPWHDGGPVAFFNQKGQGLVLWTRRYAAFEGAPADGTDVLWRAWTGSGWSGEQVLFHADTYLPSSTGYGFIPVETSGGLTWFIVWDDQCRVAEYRDSAWVGLGPWQYLGVSLADAAVDPAGIIHLAAFGPNNSQGGYDDWFDDAYYVTYDGAAWSRPVNLSESRGVAGAVGLAFDAQGSLHFLWSDPDSPFSSQSLESAIWERVFTNGDWTANAELTMDNPGQAISGFGLERDPYGVMHLVWSEGLFVTSTHTALDVYYRTGSGLAWGPEEKVYGSTALSRYPLPVADQDRVSILWEEGALGEQEIFFSAQNRPSLPCQAPSSVGIEGPSVGHAKRAYTFMAAASPVTSTFPLTYTWQASEQATVIHQHGLADSVSFIWQVTGTKAITVTVENCAGRVIDTHLVTIEAARPLVYLPLVTRSSAR